MTTITPPTSATTPAAAGASTSANDPTGALGVTQNFNTFLTLLTTQLQNQDPLSPLDSNQFTQQLVMFSQVEQQIQTNSQLSTLIAGQAASETMSALPMVGQTIEYSGNQAVLQNGQAAYSYTLPSAAASASITIQDSGGNTIFQTTADASAGTHSFVWNGQTTAGQQLPDGGTYAIQVSATAANNSAVTPTTAAIGTVTGVSVNNNVATFNVSGVAVPMSQLLTIITNSPSTASN
jgi:flagellar basal-body rod modification protein FlgD